MAYVLMCIFLVRERVCALPESQKSPWPKKVKEPLGLVQVCFLGFIEHLAVWRQTRDWLKGSLWKQLQGCQLGRTFLSSLSFSKFLFVLPIISIKGYFQGWLETESGPGSTATGERVCRKKHGLLLRAKAISPQNWTYSFLSFLFFFLIKKT